MYWDLKRLKRNSKSILHPFVFKNPPLEYICVCVCCLVFIIELRKVGLWLCYQVIHE